MNKDRLLKDFFLRQCKPNDKKKNEERGFFSWREGLRSKKNEGLPRRCQIALPYEGNWGKTCGMKCRYN